MQIHLLTWQLAVAVLAIGMLATAMRPAPHHYDQAAMDSLVRAVTVHKARR
jgi:hypothetical protein